ncbi:MAG: glycosyltransferase family 2 protein [Ferruginibacter sp.]
MNNSNPLPLISVAMATYNGMPYLQQQVESLLAQIYTNLEIVISDDGSEDGTVEYLEKQQAGDSRIVLKLNKDQHGIKNNFSNALLHCHGEYILLCDQDDYWLPGKIEAMFSKIGDAALIYHDSLFVDEAGASLGKKMSERFNCYEGNDPRAFLLYNCVSGHAAMFRRDIISGTLPFPEARYHDWWLVFASATKGNINYLPEVFVHYRQHQSSDTDLLRRKKNRKYISETEKFRAEATWYQRAASLGGNQQAYIKTWAEHYAKREHQWLSIWIFKELLRKRNLLMFIRRRRGAGLFIESLKKLWGLRLKRFFG